MGILAWLLFGLIAGAIAQLILPGNDPGGRGGLGILITIVIGIVGAFVGGLIGSVLGFGGVTEFDFRSLLIAILGAIVLLLVWRMVARNTLEHA
ncbi:MAG: GlsB/YeaQ/YmgE family stress response membrane protein [Dehalococcoidia bacterium]|nr:GlsB/YeaQ/YmgE family stress response membrane protein [Dehalococcoidia bacterium]